MITFFTTAKPFTGHNGVIQRNALKSWTLAARDAEVILFGDEEGASEAAREIGIAHVANVERSVLSSGFVSTNPETQGPKILRSFFDEAQRMAQYETVCYVNCDIILMEDFAAATAKLRTATSEYLMVGRRWDTDVTEPIAFEKSSWKEEIRERARTKDQRRSGDWIDYFAFRKGFYLGKMPEMVIGRVFWDQWLVWKAELSKRNYKLAGGRWHLRAIDDATHVLDADGLKINPVRAKRAAARFFRTAKEAAWTTAMDWTRPARRAIGLGKRES
jgi:hypothetical protein